VCVCSRSDPLLLRDEDAIAVTERAGTPPSSPIGDHKSARRGGDAADWSSRNVAVTLSKYPVHGAEVVVLPSLLTLFGVVSVIFPSVL